MLLLLALVRLLRHGRAASRGFVSEVDHATHATLHTASLAARHLRDGLTPTARPARPSTCASLLGTPAVASATRRRCSPGTARRDHHAAEARDHAEEVLRTGRTIVLRAGQVAVRRPRLPGPQRRSSPRRVR